MQLKHYMKIKSNSPDLIMMCVITETSKTGSS